MDKKEDFAEDDLPNFTLEFDFLKEEEEVLAEVLPELVAEQPKKKSRSVDSTEEERNKLLTDSRLKRPSITQNGLSRFSQVNNPITY